MVTVRRRPLKVVTDSEDDQSDSRQLRDLHLTNSSKRNKSHKSTPEEEEIDDDEDEYEDEDGNKNQSKKKKNNKNSGIAHLLPIHTITKPSVLSKEAPPENYSGFLRLGMLVLGASNIRLVIENWMKYGLLIGLPHSHIPFRDFGLFLFAWLCIPLSLIVTLVVEYGISQLAMVAATGKMDNGKPDDGDTAVLKTAVFQQQFRKKLSLLENVVGFTHFSHLVLLISFPSYITYKHIYHPIVGSGLTLICLITFLKLISYVLTNRQLRQAYLKAHRTRSNKTAADTNPTTYDNSQKITDNQKASKTIINPESLYDKEAAYPNNINLKNLLYFIFAPTLCYQPSYPRSPKFRKTFFLKRVGELCCCLAMMYILSEQYAKPTLANSIKALEDKDIIIIIERVLKLSTTAVVIWLLMFYALFHATLNILAEVLRFGDRTFYLAWWNSGNLATYWRLWNRPVYLFFKRHVYIPFVQMGVPPFVCQFLVFLVSAVLHEVLVGIPTHSITGFAFFGMLGQIPLIAITALLEKWRGKGTALGNTIFWVTFCVVGQPTIALLYYYQWTATHRISSTS